MNNKTLIGGVILILLVGGGFLVIKQQSKIAEDAKMAQGKNAMMQKEELGNETPEQEAMEKKNAMMEKTDDTLMMDNKADSRYVPYSKAAYDAAIGGRRVLYFYATWCPSCKLANEDFLANPNNIPADLVIFRVNYNDPDTDKAEKDLASKYGITYQHTFVQVDKEDKEIVKWNGGDTDEINTNIK